MDGPYDRKGMLNSFYFKFFIALAVCDFFTCLGIITNKGFPSFGDTNLSAFGSTISWVMIPTTNGGITWTGGMFITVLLSCELYTEVCLQKKISRKKEYQVRHAVEGLDTI